MTPEKIIESISSQGNDEGISTRNPESIESKIEKLFRNISNSRVAENREKRESFQRSISELAQTVESCGVSNVSDSLSHFLDQADEFFDEVEKEALSLYLDD